MINNQCYIKSKDYIDVMGLLRGRTNKFILKKGFTE